MMTKQNILMELPADILNAEKFWLLTDLTHYE